MIAVLALLLAPLGYLTLTSGGDSWTSQSVLRVGTSSLAEGVLGQTREYEQPQQRLATELEIAQSVAVADRASQRLRQEGIPIPPEALIERVDVKARGVSSLIEISGTGPGPQDAYEVTAAWSAAYIAYRGEAERLELERVAADLRDRLVSAEEELSRLEEGSANDNGPEARQRAAALARYETVTDLLERVRLRLSIDTSGVEVISPATVPTSPDRALAPPVAAVVAALAALLLSTGAAVALDLFRDPIRTRAEAEEVALASVLAELPRARRPSPRRLALALAHRSSRASLAARALRLRIDREAEHGFPRVLLVTCTPDDVRDATWVAGFLAAACGRAGQRTLLVADLDSVYELSARRSDAVALPAGVQAWATDQPGVHVAPTLSASGDELGVFDTPVVAETVRQTAELFDVVLVVEQPSDTAATLVDEADAVLLVCALGRTPARRLTPRVSELEDSDNFSGLVLTRPAPAGAMRSLQDDSADEEPEPAATQVGQSPDEPDEMRWSDFPLVHAAPRAGGDPTAGDDTPPPTAVDPLLPPGPGRRGG